MADWKNSFDGRLDVQPPLTDQQLAAIPAKRGVVALVGDGDVPILLITAADIRSRTRTRLAEPLDPKLTKSADLRQITRVVLWKLAASHFEADLEFLELAMQLWPDAYGSMLGWKQAWFVHVDPAERHPHFVRTHDVFAAGGRYFGPFPDGRSADAFIQAIQEQFDLCRRISCLRNAPNAQPCAYSQMGRCMSVCDGHTSLEDYRKVVSVAADFAAGNRKGRAEELRLGMRTAAAELKYEKAAAIKARLGRLAAFDSPSFVRVTPAEQFRFIIVQAGPGVRAARLFFFDRGRVCLAGALDYPLKPQAIDTVIRRMADFVHAGGAPGDAERWRIGLVSRYLFSSEQRKGLMLRWREGLAPVELAQAVESARQELRLHHVSRAKRGTPPSQEPCA